MRLSSEEDAAATAGTVTAEAGKVMLVMIPPNPVVTSHRAADVPHKDARAL
jgi:hypothetical protein